MKKKESAGLRLSLKQWAYLNTSYRIKKILSVFKCRARTFGEKVGVLDEYFPISRILFPISLNRRSDTPRT